MINPATSSQTLCEQANTNPSGLYDTDRQQQGHKEALDYHTPLPVPQAGARYRPVGWGILGSAAMGVLYLGIVTLAESWAHAIGLVRQDALLVLPIMVGFGVQIGLYSLLRQRIQHKHHGNAGAMAGASGGTSTTAMVACCLHHAADLLPVVGLSGAVVFLAQYRVLFMLIGLLMNLLGIGLTVHRLRRLQTPAIETT